MNKIIIYGAGKIFWDNIYKFDIHEVICIADKNAFMTPLFGCNIIRPDRITEFEFDYIVIFNKYNCDEIKSELISLGVDAKKIVSWSYYLYIIKSKLVNISEDCRGSIEEWLRTQSNSLKVLDVNQGLVNNCFHKNAFNIVSCFEFIDNLSLGDDVSVIKSIYRNMYKSNDNISDYDLITCFDFFINHSFEEFVELYKKTYSSSKYIAFTIPYAGFSDDNSWNNFEIDDGIVVFERKLQAVKLLVIEKQQNLSSSSARIYVVTHKIFTPPKNSLYQPIFAGTDNDNPMHIQGDKVEDNISDLNFLINECTVLYWMWKHSEEEIVGLNHYRRYFSLNNSPKMEDLLTKDQILKIMENCDAIVAPAYDSFPYSLKFQMQCSINERFFNSGWNAVKQIVEEKYPDYLDDFEKYFNGHFMYPCNMFIMKREILNEYCKWLFDIIIPACSMFVYKGADKYSIRTIGFIAERLFTLWLLHNDIKIKEVDMVLIQ